MKVTYKKRRGCWEFRVYDNGKFVKSGWTQVIDLELYDCMTVEEYILRWCL